MAWRVAESLKKLREQVNAAYPNRDKLSDGSIGDASHASRKSDHNPWVTDHHGIGVVTAIDIDADLSPTTSVEVLVRQLFLAKDRRIKYIIWNRKITLPGLTGWKDYHGANAHQHHCHISVQSDSNLYDSRAEWNLGTAQILTVEQPASYPPLDEQPATEPVKLSATDPTDAAQPPTVPASADVAAALTDPSVTHDDVTIVPEVNAAQSDATPPTGIRASLAGAITWITTAGSGLFAIVAGLQKEIVYGLFGAATIIGIVFVWKKFDATNKKEQLDREAQEADKTRAHEIQVLMMQSAMNKEMNTIRVVPQPPVETPPTDAATG